MIIAAALVVVSLFAFAASFSVVESLWSWLVRRASAPPRRMSPDEPDEPEEPMTETPDPRGTIARRLAAASEALGFAEADAYGRSMLGVGLKLRIDHLTEAAEQARAESEKARAAAERSEAELPEYERQLEYFLQVDVAERRAHNVRHRAGVEPRYTENGVRILDWHDDWGLQRSIIRVSEATARIEIERLRADALLGVALRLEASASALAQEREERAEEYHRLAEIVRSAQERYDAIKAEADVLEAAEPDAN